MKTVRFDPDLERKLEEISRLEGRTQSEVIRVALDRYCDDVMSRRADVAWAPSLGAASLPRAPIPGSPALRARALTEKPQGRSRHNPGRH